MSDDLEMDPDFPNQYRRKKSRAGQKFFGLLALAVAVASVPWLVKRGAELIPKGPAPEIVAAGWVNGKAPTKSDLSGKVVVISVWATWCGPCRREAPRLAAIHQKFAERGVVFIGLTDDDEAEMDKIHLFLKTAGIKWPNGWGAHQTIRDLGVEVLPSMFVIGDDGQILWASSGGNGHALPEVLESALKRAKSHS